jgi:hypothetical protein
MTAKVVSIDINHHIVRFCKKRLLIRDGDRIIGVHPELFHLRPPSETEPQETTLSAVYYEFFNGTPVERMKKCHESICVSLTSKPKDGLARLNVGLIKEQGLKRSRSLRVTHEGEESNPAYSFKRDSCGKPTHFSSGEGR